MVSLLMPKFSGEFVKFLLLQTLVLDSTVLANLLYLHHHVPRVIDFTSSSANLLCLESSFKLYHFLPGQVKGYLSLHN